MSNIVEWLRGMADFTRKKTSNGYRYDEAADRIEQLEAALREILDDVEPAAHNGATGAMGVRAIARRALEEKT
jgi:hypothetical protein